jgi:hypothetical protein
MRILRPIIFGILGGIAYAIISFVLISPHLRGNVGAVLFWGFQGFLFSTFYLIFSFLLNKLIEKVVLENTIIGALSGLFSCSFNIIVTIFNLYEGTRGPNIYVPPEMVHSLYSQLFLYAIGSLFLGVIIGYLIGQRKKLILSTHNKRVEASANRPT